MLRSKRRVHRPFTADTLESRLLFAFGEPDTGFSGDGLVDVDEMNQSYSVHLVAGNKTLVVGASTQYPNFTTVARYLRNGELDPSFSADGFESTNLQIRPGASVMQSDGKLVVAGSGSSYNQSLVRFNSNGSIDSTFGVNGQAQTFVYGNINELIVQPDGKFLLFGQDAVSIGGGDVKLVRLNANGSPDTSFGGGDAVVNGLLEIGGQFGFRPQVSQVNLNLFSDGDILLTLDSIYGDVQMVYAFKPNGTLDTSFNGIGAASFPIDYRGNLFRDVIIGPDQKIYAAGGRDPDYWGDIYRFTLGANGFVMDNTFDGDGIVNGVHVSPGAEMAIRPDGKIIVAGGDQQYESSSSTGAFVITSLTPNGQRDLTFSPNYGMKTAAFNRTSFVTAADIGTGYDDPIVMVATSSAIGGGSEVVVTRFGGAPLDVSSPSVVSLVSAGAPVYYGDASIKVSLADADGIDLSKIDINDLQVVAPDGSELVPSYYLNTEYTPGGYTVDYHMRAPGGTWDVAEDGVYQIFLKSDQLADSLGNVIPGKSLGTFTMNLRYDPAYPAYVSGVVFNDLDSDGVPEFGEAALAGRTVFADYNGNGVLDASEPSTTTSSSGNYYLPQVTPGPTRSIIASLPSGWVGTVPANSRATINLEAFALDTTVDFGQRLPANTTPVTLSALADAYVRDGSYAATNFGTAAELQLKMSSSVGSSREAYLRFDLSSVPSIANAKLRLYAKIDHATQAPEVGIFPVTGGTWGEATINWNNRPAAGTTPIVKQVVKGATAKYYEFDLTSYLAAEKAAGRNSVSLVVRSLSATDPYLIIASDEAAANRPQLVVTPSDGTTPTPQQLVVYNPTVTVPEARNWWVDVSLGAKPTSNVSVTMTRTSGDTDLSIVPPTTLTFTPTNWSQSQRVFIAAAEDADAINGTATFSFSSAGLTTKVVTATEADDDFVATPGQSFTLAPAADAYVRDGTSASQNFGASGQLIVKNDTTAGQSHETYLRFPLKNFQNASAAKLRIYGYSTSLTQSVALSIFGSSNTSWGENDINWNNKPATVGLGASSTIANGVTMSHDGGWYEFDVTSYVQQQKLAGAAAVTFVLKGTNQTPNAQAWMESDESTLWSVRPQFVVTAGTGPSPAQDLIVSVVPPASLSVPESSTNSFTVKLATAPKANVVVNVQRSSGDTDLTTAISSLTFTPANWNTPQTVTIAAATDADTTNGSAIFSISSTGLTTKSVTATEVDNTVVTPPTGQTLTLRAVADSYVRDGSYATQNFGTATQLVVKNHSYAGNARESYLRFSVADFASASSAKLRVFAKSNTADQSIGLTLFGSSNVTWSETGINWNNKPAGVAIPSAQTVNSTAGAWCEFDVTRYVEQQKAIGATAVTFVLKGVRQTDAQVLIESDETTATANRPQLVVTTGTPPPPVQELVVGPASFSVAEGATGVFGVRLAIAPTANVVVNVARSSGDADISTTMASLTFTPANWSEAQLVVLSAAQDADTANGSASFVVSSTGLTSTTVTVYEIDDDVPATPITLRATADAYVRDGSSAAANFGSATELQLKKSSSAGSTREVYLKFDISSAASPISNAKLRLNGKIDHATQTAQVAIYAVTDTSWGESTVNWNNRPQVPANATPVGVAKTVAGSALKWYEWDLTSFIAAEKAAGRTSVTLVVRSLTATDPYLIFSSDEAASNRPELLLVP